MLLRQLLGLLLVPLLDLLFPGIIGVLLGQLLMFFILSGLQLVALLVLFGIHLFLLLLILLVLLRIPGVRRSRSIDGRKIVGMHVGVVSPRWSGFSCTGGTGFRSGPTAAICRRVVGSACGLCWNCTLAQPARTGSGSDRRTAMVLRGPEFPISARCLYVFGLRSNRADVTLMHRRFFLRRRSCVYATVAVVAHVVFVIDGDAFVVHIANVGHIDVVDFAVVVEAVSYTHLT